MIVFKVLQCYLYFVLNDIVLFKVAIIKKRVFCAITGLSFA